MAIIKVMMVMVVMMMMISLMRTLVLRLVPKILHDFQHLHGFPATLNFNIL